MKYSKTRHKHAVVFTYLDDGNLEKCLLFSCCRQRCKVVSSRLNKSHSLRLQPAMWVYTAGTARMMVLQ